MTWRLYALDAPCSLSPPPPGLLVSSVRTDLLLQKTMDFTAQPLSHREGYLLPFLYLFLPQLLLQGTRDSGTPDRERPGSTLRQPPTPPSLSMEPAISSARAPELAPADAAAKHGGALTLALPVIRAGPEACRHRPSANEPANPTHDTGHGWSFPAPLAEVSPNGRARAAWDVRRRYPREGADAFRWSIPQKFVEDWNVRPASLPFIPVHGYKRPLRTTGTDATSLIPP